ncbi:MAG TPA: hypothetical protein VF761_17185 [Gemmatimonadaceae bacterium]
MKAIEDYPRVFPRIQPGTRGIAAVIHQTLSAEDAERARAKTILPVEEGESVALTIGGRCFMTDIGFERSSCLELAQNARGRVLIAGLGLGMVLPPLLEDDDVESVLIVEKVPDVIGLIAPHYEHPKLSIARGDILTWRPRDGETFDAIYFDIWPLLTPMNLVQMAYLHRAFRPYLAADGWMASWGRQHLTATVNETARTSDQQGYRRLQRILERLEGMPLDQAHAIATADPVHRSCGTDVLLPIDDGPRVAFACSGEDMQTA